MAVPACLITELPEVDLKDGDAGRMERVESRLPHFICKWRAGLGLIQKPPLRVC
jgi:hypothetical protein